VYYSLYQPLGTKLQLGKGLTNPGIFNAFILYVLFIIYIPTLALMAPQNCSSLTAKSKHQNISSANIHDHALQLVVGHFVYHTIKLCEIWFVY
jgi:hypothetical protein